MPTIRAATTDLLARVNTQLGADAARAAGSNDLVSHAEQRTFGAGVLQAAADEVRAAGGPGTRVVVDVLVQTAASKVASLLAQVNQPSGSGAGVVSMDEVRGLAALDADAGLRVARAYELITGRQVDLPSSTRPPSVTPPVTPPVVTAPNSSGALVLTNVALRAAVPFNQTATIVGEQLRLTGQSGAPTTFDLDVGAQHVHLDFAQGHVAFSGATNAVDVRSLVEGLRKALPNNDVRVAAFSRGEAIVDVWPKGNAPAVSGPVYGVAALSVPAGGFMFEMSGPLALKAGTVQPGAGESMSFRVDAKVYTSVARSAAATTEALAHDIKRQMEADGRSVELKSFNGFFSLRVTG